MHWVHSSGGEPTAKYKTSCPQDQEWDATVHLPADIRVADPRVLDRIDTATRLLAAIDDPATKGLCVAWDDLTVPDVRELLQSQIDRLSGTMYTSVQVLSPDDPVLYLGVWLPTSLRYGKALAEAKLELDNIAGNLQCAAITPAQIKEVEQTVAIQIGSWRLRMTSLTPEQLALAGAKLACVMKHKLHMCSSHPTLAFDAGLHSGLANQVLIDRIAMFLRMVDARHAIAGAMRGSLWTLQRWVGSNTPALQYEHIEAIGWNGTWIGALAMAMAKQGISIEGGKGIPHVRQQDACLVDLAPPERRQEMAIGCWTHSVWRVSDLFNAQGLRAVDLHTAHWMRPVGWRDLVLATLSTWEDATVPSADGDLLGPWIASAIPDRRYGARRDVRSGDLDVLRIISLEGRVARCTPLRRVLRAKLGRHKLDGGVTPESWMEDLGWLPCTCRAHEHPDSCYVWVDLVGVTLEGVWTEIDICDIAPMAFSRRDGKLTVGGVPKPATFLAVDEQADERGCYDTAVYNVTVPPPTDPLDGVDTLSIIGRSFVDRETTTLVRQQRAEAWERTCSRLARGDVVFAYSDCSLIKENGVTKLAYGWLFAGAASPSIIDAERPELWPTTGWKRRSTTSHRWSAVPGEAVLCLVHNRTCPLRGVRPLGLWL